MAKEQIKSRFSKEIEKAQDKQIRLQEMQKIEQQLLASLGKNQVL